MTTPTQSLFPRALLALTLLLVMAAPGLAREVVPAPADGGQGVSIFPEDNQPPFSVGPFPEEREDGRITDDWLQQAAAKSRAYDEIGGDDVFAVEHDDLRAVSMDIASNGDIYLAVESFDGVNDHTIRVYRSEDGGDSWSLWGLIDDPIVGEIQIQPHLQVVEGNVSKCFVAYSQQANTHTPQIRMSSADLGTPSAAWTEITVMSAALIGYDRPRFDTDVTSYTSFYIYLVAEGHDTNGGDVWFARSIDMGASFEAPYMIGSLPLSDREYVDPDVSYGFGHKIHVTWVFRSRDESFDSSARYRGASNFANGGLADWSGQIAFSTTSDGFDDNFPKIEGSKSGNEVVVAYERTEPYMGGSIIRDPGVAVSTDQGATWGTQTLLSGGVGTLGGLEEQPGTGNWFLVGHEFATPALQRSNVANLTSWTSPESFADESRLNQIIWLPTMALDPTHGDRVAVAWNLWGEVAGTDPKHVLFDAEWRTDPGYPNYEEGFPIDLASEPNSDPALVDLNGDGYLEIVFSDDTGNVRAIRHDGSNLPGWPVHPGPLLSPGPVAIGALVETGELSVVVGSADGRVYCYDTAGNLVDGWPYDTGEGSSAYVSIGAIGGPLPRAVVVCADDRIELLDHRGETFPGSHAWIVTGHPSVGPAAIGDIDGDGISEIVAGFNRSILAFNVQQNLVKVNRTLSTYISDAPTLGDFEHDGDVEIVVPTGDGKLYLIQGDGTDYSTAWPFTSPTAYDLNSAAIAQMLGTWEPEIAVAARSWTVHVLFESGNEGYGYPVETGGWNIHGSTIIGRVDGSSSDVVVGARGQRGWAWANLGALIPGWPKGVTGNIYQTPAMGDIDLDGSNEVVFLTLEQLVVVDVNNSPNDPSRTWAMYGHDPQRTGCADCPEDVLTPVAQTPDGEVITRVSFATPYPNPIAGSTVFQYAIPGRAVVSLEIYDVRGRRVRTVRREEAEAGQHVLGWDGRDDRGARLASGAYFARLAVNGPGIREELSRKISILR